MGFLRIKHKTPKIVQSYYKKCTYASKMSKSLFLGSFSLYLGCVRWQYNWLRCLIFSLSFSLPSRYHFAITHLPSNTFPIPSYLSSARLPNILHLQRSNLPTTGAQRRSTAKRTTTCHTPPILCSALTRRVIFFYCLDMLSSILCNLCPLAPNHIRVFLLWFYHSACTLSIHVLLLSVKCSAVVRRVNILLLPRLVVEYSVLSLFLIPESYSGIHASKP